MLIARTETMSDEDYEFALNENRKAKIKEAVVAIKNWLNDQEYSGLPLVPVTEERERRDG